MEHLLRTSGFTGRIITPSSSEYAEALLRDNAAAERKAYLITIPETPEDVACVVTTATRLTRKIAIKCGGHHPSTASSIEDGVVIDMRAFKSINISKEQMEVTIGAGNLWGDVYSALDKEEVTCVGGGVHVVGVGGHLLGGGYGPLSSRLGLASDHIISVRAVLADGSIVIASDDERSDLMWALRGGSSSFAVVTHFTLRLFPHPGPLTFQALVFPGTSFCPLLKAFLEFQKTVPHDQATGFFGFARGPPPEHIPMVTLTMTRWGAIEDLRSLTDPFVQIVEPIVDKIIYCPTLLDVSHTMDDILLLGHPRKAGKIAPITRLWPCLAEEIWRRWMDYTDSNPDAMGSKVIFECLNSIRHRPSASCFPVTESRHSSALLIEEHQNPGGDEKAEKYVHELSKVVRFHEIKHGGKDLGLNGNGCTFPEKSEEIWGHNYPKLQKVKAKYDPNCVFDRYFHIEPDYNTSVL